MGRAFITRPVWILRVFVIAVLSVSTALFFIGITPKYAGATPVGAGTLSGDNLWTLAQSPYAVSGDVAVGAGATLTVEAGVVVKFAQHSGIAVQSGGSLVVQGSAPAPVVFTDFRDDTAGGDTNGDPTLPVTGSWKGIKVDGGDASLFNAEIRYADSGVELYSTSADPMIMNCRFKNNDVGIFISDTSGTTTITGCYLSGNSYGITLFGVSAPSEGSIFVSKSTITGNDVGIFYSDGPHVVIGGSDSSRNNILKNTAYGVENESPDILVNATHNWWGDYSGPTHVSNPSGKGDAVSDYVDFSDFARISALAGDLNNDNGVGLDDVIIGLQVMTGITPAGFHPEYAIAGIDVNGDGKAGLAEAIYNLCEVAGVNE